MTDSIGNAMVGDMDALPSDVSNMELALPPEQKVRMVSLMMGIRYYTETIIKDAAYLQLMMQREKEAKFSNDAEEQHLWHLKPASVNGVLRCAQEFEQFLLGNRPGVVLKIKHGDGTEETIEPVEQPDPESRGGPQDGIVA